MSVFEDVFNILREFVGKSEQQEDRVDTHYFFGKWDVSPFFYPTFPNFFTS